VFEEAPAAVAWKAVDPVVVELVNWTLQVPPEPVVHGWLEGLTASPEALMDTVSPCRFWLAD
jgi:hypothetical protein